MKMEEFRVQGSGLSEAVPPCPDSAWSFGVWDALQDSATMLYSDAQTVHTLCLQEALAAAAAAAAQDGGNRNNSDDAAGGGEDVQGTGQDGGDALPYSNSEHSITSNQAPPETELTEVRGCAGKERKGYDCRVHGSPVEQVQLYTVPRVPACLPACLRARA